ncbi:sensor histidine kinase [Pseudonocardia sp. GCM10023141]|uniref:sensor histidine kinase n=1 Tax=Pseudonocardia sp. GCM10023141 TaxID=3252653 RepID=UPI003606713E
MSEWPDRWPERLRTLPPQALDGALTVAALVAQSAPFLFTRSGDGHPWTLLQYLPVLVVALPVFFRRVAPMTCLVVVAAGIGAYSLLGTAGPEQPIWFGALIVMYTVADQCSRRRRLVALVASAVGVAVIGGVFGSVAVGIREAFLWGAAYALGRAADLRRANTVMREERAAERERARIARDMHDVLAHAVSLMIVQAEAGPVVVRSAPDRAEAAFDAVAAAGRDAMVQLRQLLGLLTADREPAPQPGLAAVPDLVAGVGTHVALSTTGAARPLAPAADVAAYRIIQESLTNIVKHADAGRASVGLVWTDAELVITVVDDGARPSTTGAGGHGLIGISERAAACGGSATYGPAGERGFRVSARLPVARP